MLLSREISHGFKIKKREATDTEERSGRNRRTFIIIPMMWTENEEEIAKKERLIDIRAEVSFLEKRWTEENEIRIKQGSCMRSLRLADETRKTIRYQVKGKLINEKEKKVSIDIWITELEKKDIIVEQD